MSDTNYVNISYTLLHAVISAGSLLGMWLADHQGMDSPTHGRYPPILYCVTFLFRAFQVPGIGLEYAEILAKGEGEQRVTNTYQLNGKFLALRGPEVDDHEVQRE